MNTDIRIDEEPIEEMDNYIFLGIVLTKYNERRNKKYTQRRKVAVIKLCTGTLTSSVSKDCWSFQCLWIIDSDISDWKEIDITLKFAYGKAF